jgi:hypothetical protein
MSVISSTGRKRGIKAREMLMTGMQRTRMEAQVAYGSIDLKETVNAVGVLV